MLQVDIPQMELYDEERNLFIYTKSSSLKLEHSLVSLSKWESKWHKSYLWTKEKSKEEFNDYVRCMTITQNIDQSVYEYIPDDIVHKIMEYIDDPMTATKLPKETGGSGRRIITSELIYYWMTEYNIPMECQKWHLNRLLTLINVCAIEKQPKKKMSKKDILAQNRAENARRRAMLHTKG